MPVAHFSPAIHIAVSASAVVIYDWLLTLHLEIKLIWSTPWTYTKCLFLVIRYVSFVNLALAMTVESTPDISLASCEKIFPVPGWTIPSHILSAEIILSIRTWAVWHRNKSVGIGLGLIVITCFCVQYIEARALTRSLVFSPPLYPGFRGCIFTRTDSVIRITLTSIATYAASEAVVLVLMSISAFRLYRQGNNGDLTHVIHRDGILFYFYLLAFNVTNFVFVLNVPVDLTTTLIPLQEALYTVLTCRIVLNIRGMYSRQGMRTELHTTLIPESLHFATRAANEGESMEFSFRSTPR